MKVCFLHPTYWPEVHRGAERFIDDLGRGLAARGHRPRLLTSHPTRTDSSVEAGLPVTRVKRPRGEDRLRRWRFDDYWTHVPAQARALARDGAGDELVHAFYPTDGVVAGRWSRRTGRPSILSVLGLPNPHVKVRFDALPRAARACTATTVMSRWVRDGLWWRYGIEARVVPGMVDLDAFFPGERAAQPTVFCAAAPDVGRKRVDLLVRAFARVRRERADARLVLMRPGNAERARALAAEPGVELVAPATDGLQPLYASAWATALPSIGEAFGLVLVESLACGTPVVGTDAGAFPEIVDRPEVGRLFSGGEDELARALLEALELGADPSSVAACRSRASDFSAHAVVGIVEELYRELSA